MDNSLNSTTELIQNANEMLIKKETEYSQLPDIKFPKKTKGNYL